jgi:hypothetical protein
VKVLLACGCEEKFMGLSVWVTTKMCRRHAFWRVAGVGAVLVLVLFAFFTCASH